MHNHQLTVKDAWIWRHTQIAIAIPSVAMAAVVIFVAYKVVFSHWPAEYLVVVMSGAVTGLMMKLYAMAVLKGLIFHPHKPTLMDDDSAWRKAFMLLKVPLIALTALLIFVTCNVIFSGWPIMWVGAALSGALSAGVMMVYVMTSVKGIIFHQWHK